MTSMSLQLPLSAAGNESVVPEDSNNNTSVVTQDQTTIHFPSIREIHKNSWLKRMPCIDRWSGRFPKSQRPEKFWVVFCVHDDKEAFLEFYENRRSAYSHMPLSNIPLSKCLHISPTIVAQENDHEFVITLESQVIRLAATTNEQMLEWMDTMRTKLREMGVLEPKDNLYSKEPIHSNRSENPFDCPTHEEFNRLSLRDPNSPLPPVPIDSQSESSPFTVMYIRNPPIQRASVPSVSSSSAAIPIPSPTDSAAPLRNVFNFENTPLDSDLHHQGVALQDSMSQSTNPSQSDSESSASSILTVPPSEQILYEPLFSPPTSISLGVRNPNYENPPQPHHQVVSNVLPTLPPRQTVEQRHMSSPVVSDLQFAHSSNITSRLSNISSTSDPSLNTSSQATSSEQTVVSDKPAVLLRSHSQQDSGSGHALPRSDGPPPYSVSRQPTHNLQADESGKLLSLREVQVQKLQSEILHKSGVRLVLRKKDCTNTIALVECFNLVW